MTDRTPNPRYSLRTAATRAHMAPATLATLIEEGKVPSAYKAGKRYYIFAAPFDRWAGLAEPAPVVQNVTSPIDFVQRRKAS